MKKRTKAEQAELEAIRKTHEEHKLRDKQQIEFQKKLFPNGVLKRGTESQNPKQIPQVIQDLVSFFETRFNEFPPGFVSAFKNFLVKYSSPFDLEKEAAKLDRIMLLAVSERLQSIEEAKGQQLKKAVEETNKKKTTKAERRRKKIKKHISKHPSASPQQIIDALKLTISRRQVSNDLNALKNMEKR